jgi:hypothetical protein
MKKLFVYSFVLILAQLFFPACSSDDDRSANDVNKTVTGNEDSIPPVVETNALYAIVRPENEQVMDILPSDYVLTLDNIVAANPETGEFKLKDTERMDSKTNPAPTQYYVQFYSEGTFLFEAKLNSVYSSVVPQGLTFYQSPGVYDGLTCYVFRVNPILATRGEVVEVPTEQQKQGMRRMYQILQEAGKLSGSIDYFKFNDDISDTRLIGKWDLVEVLNGPDGHCDMEYSKHYPSGSVIVELNENGTIVFNYEDGRSEVLFYSDSANPTFRNSDAPVVFIGETPFSYTIEDASLSLHYGGVATADHIPATFVLKRISNQ